MARPTVFIGSSVPGLNIARAIQANLHRDAACVVWPEGVFRPGNFTLEALENEAGKRDFAILALTPDILQSDSSGASFAPRPNVLFELGLFMGKLGRRRVFAVHPRDRRMNRPSDLAGLTLLDYEAQAGIPLAAALGPACDDIRFEIEQQGIIPAAPSLVDRSQVPHLAGSLESRLNAAVKEVRISGFDCRYALEENGDAVEAALQRGVVVKLLCLDPKSEAAIALLDKVRRHYPTAEQFDQSITQSQATFAKWRRCFPDNFEARFLPIIPSVGMFISDPDTVDGVVKIELYTHDDNDGAVSRPHLLIPPTTSVWRKYFLNQWALYWKASRKFGDDDCEKNRQPPSVSTERVEHAVHI